MSEIRANSIVISHHGSSQVKRSLRIFQSSALLTISCPVVLALIKHVEQIILT